MSKYRIAWMPGDGIGIEVMDATKVVLDAVGFDAEYVPAEIGWELWRTEGEPLPVLSLVPSPSQAPESSLSAMVGAVGDACTESVSWLASAEVSSRS